MRAFYCGQCDEEWQIESATPDAGERRRGDRRFQQREALPSKRLRAKLRPRRNEIRWIGVPNKTKKGIKLESLIPVM